MYKKRKWKKRTCRKCCWYGSCPDGGNVCEHYDPVEDGGDERHYLQDLRERAAEYRKIEKDFKED